MSEQTLLPCPFCGGEAKPTAHLTYSWFAPVCKSCGVRGPSVRIERGSDPQKMRELMNKADALWNRRAAPVAQPVAMIPVEILDRFPEINPSNYGHDDVCNLNSWGVEVVLAATEPKDKP